MDTSWEHEGFVRQRNGCPEGWACRGTRSETVPEPGVTLGIDDNSKQPVTGV